MPQVPTTPTANNTATATRTPGSRPLRVPPEEQFWKRYSPHHEFQVSSAASFTLHVLILGLFVVAGIILLNQAGSEDKAIPNMDSVVEAGDLALGNEGDPRGGSGGGGTGGKDERNARQENVDKSQKNTSNDNGEGGHQAALEDPPEPPPVNVQASQQGTRTIVDGVPKDLKTLQGQVAYKTLTRAGGGRGSKGSGGGEGGGEGTGSGTKAGKGIGAGSEGEVAKRARRQLRWRVIFSSNSNGSEYRDKLRAMKAILVAAEIKLGPNGEPIRASNGEPILQYRQVIRDIRPNSKPEIEDVRPLLERIFWVDDKPHSVGPLARALGIPTPPLFACFFPVEVEQNLRALEKKKYKGVENDIRETVFTVSLDSGAGRSFRLRCEEVRLNNGRVIR